jgi:branched-chain amino acid transport system permease protein
MSTTTAGVIAAPTQAADRRKAVLITVLLLLLLIFPALPLTGIPFLQSLASQANVDVISTTISYALLAMGLNIVVGFAGLLDLGYAAFFAIGAYLYGVLTAFQVMPPWSGFWEPFQVVGLVHKISMGGADVVHFTLSFWLAIPLAAGLAALFGVLFGFPTLRLQGDYLAIVTLGFGEIVPLVFLNADPITNGAAGLNGIQAPHLFGYNFGVNAIPYFYVAIVLLVILTFVSIRLRDSRVGRAWMAIREDEIGASAMGVNLVNYKLLAFASGAAIAGIAGTFYIAKLQTATPDMFNFNVSAMILVMVVLGGMGSVWGAIAGATMLSFLQFWFLQDLTNWIHFLGRVSGIGFLVRLDLVQSIDLIFGIILVVMMLYRREGLIPAVRRSPNLGFDAQHAVVQRGGFVGVEKLGRYTVEPGNALEIKDVTVRFGGLVALNKVNLVVPSGGVVAVIGPNGSGKSTLFNVITGLVRAESGSISFRGEDILGLAPHQILEKGVARTFQNIRIFPNLTVLENVLIGEHARLRTGPVGAILRPPGTKAEEKRAVDWAKDIITMFGNRLAPRIAQTVSGLSYANRRRVEIARALASRPKILLLDEPTAGMNPNETLELAEQIRDLKSLGLTILLIEHKLDVVTRLADNVIVLDHGEKIAEGPADEVRRNEEVLRAYLGRAAGATHAA